MLISLCLMLLRYTRYGRNIDILPKMKSNLPSSYLEGEFWYFFYISHLFLFLFFSIHLFIFDAGLEEVIFHKQDHFINSLILILFCGMKWEWFVLIRPHLNFNLCLLKKDTSLCTKIFPNIIPFVYPTLFLLLKTMVKNINISFDLEKDFSSKTFM